MRWSRGGLIVGGIYVALAAACLAMSALTDDAKGVVVFGQLAILPGLLVLAHLGLDEWLTRIPGPVGWAAMLLLSLGLAYGLGWVAGWLVAWSRPARPR